jgi:hypothetical protein
MVIIFILILFSVAALIVSGFMFLSYQTTARERKNYERALKMVPLLIHLPPMSEDIEINGRDARDVVDENISKAQIIYNILASTAQKKSFKTNLYGQRHLSLEIVGNKGLIYFYVMVPIALVDVVKQAIISAYTSAQVEEVSEHNIFNPVGKATGVSGGEFILKKEFAYPIGTYREVKRDTMQAVLNALSTLEKEDGVCIQILLRPAEASWQSIATSLAQGKRKGNKSKSVLQHTMSWGQQLLVAFTQPPDITGTKKDDKPDLSSLEQANLDAIDDKTRHPGYETKIRVVVSSNISRRSQAILANVVAAFSLFDAPGRNGFKYVPAEQVDALVSDYILRLFPQQHTKMVLNSVELATLFHFPDQRNIPTSQLQRQESKQVDAPRNMPSNGLLLGYNVFRGVKKPIRLEIHDRQRHMYVVGQTGTGKSTFLENLALQDMLSGNGFAFVDPHGDTAERLLSMIPKERTEDIIYFSPADMAHPMGVNIFEYDTPDQKDFLIQEALNMLYKLYDPQHSGIMGPRYEHLFRNAALTIMADPSGGTFIDIPKLFRDPKFVQQKLKFVTDPNVREFWEREMPQSQRSNEFGDVVSWFVSKFGAFLSNEMMRNIIGQTKSAFNLREVMDNKKILLVNLSKGRTGELNSKLLGMFFVMKFQAAAMSRANVPEKDRQDFALYVDEFQNFSTDSFATILSEARKYHLNLIVANQYTHQLSNEIRDAVFGNVGTVVSFRVGNDDDADVLAKRMQPAFSPGDLLRMPNYNAAVRTMTNGVPTQPFSMATLPPLGNPNEKLGEALKQLSGAKHGRPKLQVEEEIFARMKTQELARPPFGSSPPSPSQQTWPTSGVRPPLNPSRSMPHPEVTAPLPMAANSGQKSFLDDWLAKRKTFSGNAVDSLANDSQHIVGVAPTPVDNMLSAAQPVPNNKAGDMFIHPDKHLAGMSGTNPTPVGVPPQQDTIYIDKDGMMHSHERDKSESTIPNAS